MAKDDSLVATRSKRANAGSRLKQLIALEEQSNEVEISSQIINDDDENVNLLFQEDDDDIEFVEENLSEEAEENDEDEDEEEQNEPQIIDENDEPATVEDELKQLMSDEDEGSAHKVHSDDVLSDSDISLSETDDEEGEKELQKQERLKKRKLKRQNKIIPEIKKPKLDLKAIETIDKPKKSHSKSSLTTSNSLLMSMRRSSSRASAVESKQALVQRLQESEKRRANIAPITRVKERELTQEERLAEAVETEKANILSLNQFREQEIVKNEYRKNLLALKREKLKNVIRFVSQEAFVTPIDELREARISFDLNNAKKRKKPGRRKKIDENSPKPRYPGEPDPSASIATQVEGESILQPEIKQERDIIDSFIQADSKDGNEEENVSKSNQKVVKEEDNMEIENGHESQSEKDQITVLKNDNTNNVLKNEEHSSDSKKEQSLKKKDEQYLEKEEECVSDNKKEQSHDNKDDRSSDNKDDQSPSHNIQEKVESLSNTQAESNNDTELAEEEKAEKAIDTEGVQKTIVGDMKVQEVTENISEKEKVVPAADDEYNKGGFDNPETKTSAMNGSASEEKETLTLEHDDKEKNVSPHIDSGEVEIAKENENHSSSNKDISENAQETFETKEKRVTFADDIESPVLISLSRPETPQLEGNESQVQLEELFEGPPQRVARNLIYFINFDEEQKDYKLNEYNIKTILLGEQSHYPASRRFRDTKTILKIGDVGNPYASVKEEKDEMFESINDLDETNPMFEELKRLPKLGVAQAYVEEIEEDTKEEETVILLKTDAPTGLYLPNNNKKNCLITGGEVKYFDPSNGLPYSSVEAYKILKTIEQGNVPWYNFSHEFNSWGGSEIYLGSRIGNVRHAKGVPEGFDG